MPEISSLDELDRDAEAQQAAEIEGLGPSISARAPLPTARINPTTLAIKQDVQRVAAERRGAGMIPPGGIGGRELFPEHTTPAPASSAPPINPGMLEPFAPTPPASRLQQALLDQNQNVPIAPPRATTPVVPPVAPAEPQTDAQRLRSMIGERVKDPVQIEQIAKRVESQPWDLQRLTRMRQGLFWDTLAAVQSAGTDFLTGVPGLVGTTLLGNEFYNTPLGKGLKWAQDAFNRGEQNLRAQAPPEHRALVDQQIITPSGVAWHKLNMNMVADLLSTSAASSAVQAPFALGIGGQLAKIGWTGWKAAAASWGIANGIQMGAQTGRDTFDSVRAGLGQMKDETGKPLFTDEEINRVAAQAQRHSGLAVGALSTVTGGLSAPSINFTKMITTLAKSVGREVPMEMIEEGWQHYQQKMQEYEAGASDGIDLWRDILDPMFKAGIGAAGSAGAEVAGEHVRHTLTGTSPTVVAPSTSVPAAPQAATAVAPGAPAPATGQPASLVAPTPTESAAAPVQTPPALAAAIREADKRVTPKLRLESIMADPRFTDGDAAVQGKILGQYFDRYVAPIAGAQAASMRGPFMDLFLEATPETQPTPSPEAEAPRLAVPAAPGQTTSTVEQKPVEAALPTPPVPRETPKVLVPDDVSAAIAEAKKQGHSTEDVASALVKDLVDEIEPESKPLTKAEMQTVYRELRDGGMDKATATKALLDYVVGKTEQPAPAVQSNPQVESQPAEPAKPTEIVHPQAQPEQQVAQPVDETPKPEPKIAQAETQLAQVEEAPVTGQKPGWGEYEGKPVSSVTREQVGQAFGALKESEIDDVMSRLEKATEQRGDVPEHLQAPLAASMIYQAVPKNDPRRSQLETLLGPESESLVYTAPAGERATRLTASSINEAPAEGVAESTPPAFGPDSVAVPTQSLGDRFDPAKHATITADQAKAMGFAFSDQQTAAKYLARANVKPQRGQSTWAAAKLDVKNPLVLEMRQVMPWITEAAMGDAKPLGDHDGIQIKTPKVLRNRGFSPTVWISLNPQTQLTPIDRPEGGSTLPGKTQNGPSGTGSALPGVKTGTEASAREQLAKTGVPRVLRSETAATEGRPMTTEEARKASLAREIQDFERKGGEIQKFQPEERRVEQKARETGRPQVSAFDEEAQNHLDADFHPTEEPESEATQVLDSRSSAKRREPEPASGNLNKFMEGSKVVNPDGSPKTLYHGTGGLFDSFDLGEARPSLYGTGIYLTESKPVADEYANGRFLSDREKQGRTPTVLPLYASIKNPFDTEKPAGLDDLKDIAGAVNGLREHMKLQPMRPYEILEALGESGRSKKTAEQYYEAVKEGKLSGDELYKNLSILMRDHVKGTYDVNDLLAIAGYDGIKYMGAKPGMLGSTVGVNQHQVWIAFDPRQVKHATENTGAFNPEDARMRNAEGEPSSEPVTPARRKQVVEELTRQAARMFPNPEDKPLLQFMQKINRSGREAQGIEGGETVGQYDPAHDVLRIAVTGQNPFSTMMHEATHRARNRMRMADANKEIRFSALTNIQNEVLEHTFAEGSKATQQLEDVLRKRGNEGAIAQLNEGKSWVRQEERIAHAAQAWFEGSAFTPEVDGFFGKMWLFMERLGNFVRHGLRAQGFTSAHDIFSAINAGELSRDGGANPNDSLWGTGREDLNAKGPVAPTNDALEAARAEAAAAEREIQPVSGDYTAKQRDTAMDTYRQAERRLRDLERSSEPQSEVLNSKGRAATEEEVAARYEGKAPRRAKTPEAAAAIMDKLRANEGKPVEGRPAGAGKIAAINNSSDVHELLAAAAATGDDLRAARGNRQPDAITAKVAHIYGVSPEQLLKWRSGQPFNAPEAAAAQRILKDAAVDLKQKATAAKGGSDQQKAEAAVAMLHFMGIHESVASAATEMGRAFRALRSVNAMMEAGNYAAVRSALNDVAARPVGESQMEKIAAAAPGLGEGEGSGQGPGVEPGAGPGQGQGLGAGAGPGAGTGTSGPNVNPGALTDQALQEVIDSFNAGSLREISTKVREIYQKKWYHPLLEWRTGILLTSPVSWTANVASNLANQASKYADTAVAAMLGKVLPRPSEIAGNTHPVTDGPERVLAGELAPMLYGDMRGLMEGLPLMLRAFKHEDGSPLFAGSKMDTPRMKAIPGPIGRASRVGMDMMMALDEGSKAMTYISMVHGLSYRQASQEGLTGDARTTRSDQLAALAYPHVDERGQWQTPEVEGADKDIVAKISEEARAESLWRAYSTESPFVNKLNTLLRSNQGAEIAGTIIMPFRKVPVNLFKQATERTFGAALLPWQLYRAYKEGSSAQNDMKMAREMVGAGVSLLVAALAAAGLATGAGPEDQERKKMQRMAGMQPNALGPPGASISFGRVDPWGMQAGVVSDMTRYLNGMDRPGVTKQDPSFLDALRTSLVQSMLNKTFLQGPGDFIDALQTKGGASDRAQRYVRNLVASFLVPTAVRQMANTVDPTIRDAQSILQEIQNRVPFAKNSLPARRLPSGDEMRQEGAWGPDIASPFYKPSDKVDPIAKELDRLRMGISAPEQEIRNNKLTPQQKSEYHELAGRELWSNLGYVINGPEWDGLDDDEKRLWVGKIKRSSYEFARGEFLMRYPDLIEKPAHK